MKKLIFVLAIFVAVPAFATNVFLTPIDETHVAIDYNDADPCDKSNMPRAFGLDVTIDAPGTFTGIGGYYQGESTSGNPRYGIYPARISIDDSNGVVKGYGSPLADDTNDPGAGGGIPSSHVVLESASLYYGLVNAPATSGRLCILEYSCNDGENLIIAMTDEDTYRGGLVFEDGTEGDVNDTLLVCEVDECFPSCHPDYTEWQAMGEPNSWCNPRQCHGDADGEEEGNPKDGYFWVSSNDLNHLSAGWRHPYSGDPDVDGPDPGSEPDYWISADFDHVEEGNPKDGYFRVSSGDLNQLSANWRQAVVDANCLDCP